MANAVICINDTVSLYPQRFRFKLRPNVEPCQLGVYETGVAEPSLSYQTLSNITQTWSLLGSSKRLRKIQAGYL